MSDAPERELARALEHGLRDGFSERGRTALHLAELLLDAVDEALPLARGRGSAAELELLAQRADVYGWDGPPGWDEVLARGIGERGELAAGMSPLDGLGDPPGREDQRQLAGARLQTEAQRLVALGREAAQLGASSGASATELAAHPTLPPGGILVAAHASLLRLFSLSSASTLLELPEDLQAGGLPPPPLDAILPEVDSPLASRSEFSRAPGGWAPAALQEQP